MKRFCFLAVALVALCASCLTEYIVREKYTDYSEIINIPGASAELIYNKTSHWIETKESDNIKRWPTSYGITKEEKDIIFKDSGNTVSFHIEDEQCQMTIQLLKIETRVRSETEAQKRKIFQMDRYKKSYISAYLEYINKPPLPQSEINAIIAKGDAAFTAGKYSEAEKYYRQALDELIFASTPIHADFYLSQPVSVTPRHTLKK